MTWRAFMYPKALANLFGGTSAGDSYKVDWLSDTIKIVGLKSAYSPSTADEFYADVSTHEISSAIDTVNHPAGGRTIPTRTMAYPVSGVVSASGGGVLFGSWVGSGLLFDVDAGVQDADDVRWGVVYDDSVTNDPLLGYVDFNKFLVEPDDRATLFSTCGPIVFQFHAPQTGQCRWFGKAMANALGGETSGESRATDYLSDTIKVALLTNSYVPSLDSNEQWSTISGNEASGSGYTAGGQALTTKSLTLSGKTLSFGADNPTWTLTASSVRWAVAYNDTNADKPLLWLYDLQADFAPVAEPLTLHLAGGLLATLRCV